MGDCEGLPTYCTHTLDWNEDWLGSFLGVTKHAKALEPTHSVPNIMYQSRADCPNNRPISVKHTALKCATAITTLGLPPLKKKATLKENFTWLWKSYFLHNKIKKKESFYNILQGQQQPSMCTSLSGVLHPVCQFAVKARALTLSSAEEFAQVYRATYTKHAT